MQKKNKKFMIVLLAVIALTLVFALALSACEKPTGNTGDDVTVDDGGNGGTPAGDNENNQTGEGGNGQEVEPEPAIPTIDVAFSDAMTFTMEDVETLSDYLKVNYTQGSDSRKVGFRVKDSKLTDDGRFIEVVVAAEGLEKTVLLPYASEDEALIRTELRPLYATLKEESDQKAFTFKITGTYIPKEGDEPMTFNLKAVVNLFDEDGDIDFNFALYSENGDNQQVFVLYDDGMLNIGGMPVDVNKFMPLVNYFMGNEEEDDELPSAVEELAVEEAPAGEEQEVGEGEGNDVEEPGAGEGEDVDEEEDKSSSMLFNAFVMLSGALNKIDELTQNKFLKYLDLFDKAEGGYVAKCDSGMITGAIDIIKVFLTKSDIKLPVDLDSVIDFLDEISGGAFKNGDILFGASFGFVGASVGAEAYIANDSTGMLASVSIELATENKAIELPDISGQEPFDVEITVPFVLPQNNLDLLIDVIVHTSDMFVQEGRDYVTANVYYNQQEEPIFTIVLNDNYAYANAMGWAELLRKNNDSDKDEGEGSGENVAEGENEDTDEESDEEPEEIYIYYNTFTVFGKVVSFIDYLPVLIFDEPSDIFSYGYGCDIIGGTGFPIGTTEAEFRERLFVYVKDKNGEKIPYSDYVIKNFSSQYVNYCWANIVYSDDYSKYVSYCIYDPELLNENIYFDSLLIELGTDKEVVEESIHAYRSCSAGRISWTADITDAEFEITDLSHSTVQNVTGFDYVGDYDVVVLFENKTYTISAYVYDPDNLIPKTISNFYGYVFVERNATLEDIRDALRIEIAYDDGSTVIVDDYTIEGYQVGTTNITVAWGNLSTTLQIIYFNTPSEEDDDDDFDWKSILRFYVEKDEKADVWGIIEAVKDIIMDNTELFGKVLVYESDENGEHFTLALNNADDVDCFAILNLFIGMPDEEGGFIDFSDEMLLSIIDQLDDEIAPFFKAIMGVELEDFISPLYFKLDFSCEDGVSVTVELCDGEEISYFVTGVTIKKIAPAPQFVLPESLENAYSFTDFWDNIEDLLFMSIGGEYAQ